MGGSCVHVISEYTPGHKRYCEEIPYLQSRNCEFPALAYRRVSSNLFFPGWPSVATYPVALSPLISRSNRV